MCSLLASLWLAGCVTPMTARTGPDSSPTTYGHGVFHTVQRGQTLWRIARAYGVRVDELLVANQLPYATLIETGTRLWIPRATHVRDVPPAGGMSEVRSTPVAAAPTATVPAAPMAEKGTGAAASRPARASPVPVTSVAASHSRFIWPVKGPVESPFGARGDHQHDGIDIKADKGTPVMAADAGEVLYAGTQRGYGNIVLVKHSADLITIYAHNDANRVKAGDLVKQGQILAIVGQTGNATNNHLHFEVRQDRVPRDPLMFLPAPQAVLAARK